MSSQHKAPLAAFFVVSIACIVVVVNALRSDAITGIFVRPTQAVVAGARLVPAPQDILTVEAKIVARASTAVTLAHEVVDEPVATKALSRHHRAHHATVAAPAAVQPAVPAAPAPVQHHHAASAAHLPVLTAPHLTLPALPLPASNGKAKGHGRQATGHSGQARGRGHGQAIRSHGRGASAGHQVRVTHPSAAASAPVSGHAFGQSSTGQGGYAGGRASGHGHSGKGWSDRH